MIKQQAEAREKAKQLAEQVHTLPNAPITFTASNSQSQTMRHLHQWAWLTAIMIPTGV
jgi:hypothetical protein